MGTCPCVHSAAGTPISCEMTAAKPATRFLIVGTPRSGSHWLISALSGHPDILCGQEELLDDPYLRDHADFAADPWGGLEELWRRGREAQKTVGFKVFYFQCWDYYQEKRHLWYRLGDEKDIAVVFLIRENLLKLALSWKKARLTKQWSIKDPSRRIEVPPVEFDPAELRQMFEHIQAGLARIETFFRGHAQLSVTYEHLFEDPESCLNAIQGFLGVSRLPLVGTFVQQETKPPHVAIRNFAALRRSFVKTEYAAFFDGAS